MTDFRERFCTLRGEFKSRAGYALISAISVTIILLLVRFSEMPEAEKNVTLSIIAFYAIATAAAHLVADATCYMAIGLKMQRTIYWQGTLNSIIAAAAMSAMFYYIDIATPGHTFMFSETAEPTQWQAVACNCLLACITVAITAAFARGSVHRQEARSIERECEEINTCIARCNAAKAAIQGPIIMNQIVTFETGGRQLEIAVCDMIYAHRRDNKNTTIVHRLGAKTCRTALDKNITDVMQAFDGYGRIIRCHGDYIVNAERVTRAEPKADRYELHLRGTMHTVPVNGKYRNDTHNALTDDKE